MEEVCAGGRAQPNGLIKIRSPATDSSSRQKERDELYGPCLPHADTQLLPFHNSPVIQCRSETLSGGLGLRLLLITRSCILPGGEGKKKKNRRKTVMRHTMNVGQEGHSQTVLDSRKPLLQM
ncbi:hypothetical protein QQF64_032547 [Cirrhinus molitorella]|uniref:Uncharacterized protein n=1 Tax=Cirrhinus molitorella TaxID=172907 RepID=A0ABR3N045_9TELE